MKRLTSFVLVIALVLSMCTLGSVATATPKVSIDFSLEDVCQKDSTGLTFLEYYGGVIYVSDNAGGTGTPSTTEGIRTIATPRRNASNHVVYFETAGTPGCDWNDETYIFKDTDGRVVLRYFAPFWIVTDYSTYGLGDEIGGSIKVGYVTEGSFSGVLAGFSNGFGNNVSGIDYVATSGYGFTFTPDADVVRVVIYNTDNSMTYYDFHTGVDLTASYNDVALYLTADGGYVKFGGKKLAKIVINGSNGTIYDIEDTSVASTDKANAGTGSVPLVFEATGDSKIYYETMRIADGVAPSQNYDFVGLGMVAVNVGEDLQIGVMLEEYPLCPGFASAEGYTLKYTVNEIESNVEPIENVFWLTGLVMTDMNKPVKMELIKNEVVVDTINNWTIRNYLDKDLAGEPTVAELAADVSRLGSEIDKYLGGTGWTSYSEKASGISADKSEYTPKNVVSSQTNTGVDKFTAASLVLGEKINIKFKFDSSSATKIIIRTAGEANVTINDLSEGYVMTRGISASELDRVFTATLYGSDDTELGSVSYSAANYIYNKFDTVSAQQGIVQALAAIAKWQGAFAA